MAHSWLQLAALGYQYGHFCVPIVSHRIVTFGYLTQWLGEPTEGGPISVTILRAPLCKPRNAREYALKCIFYRFALAEMGKTGIFWWFWSQQKIDDNASAKHPSNETAPVPILIKRAFSCRSGWFGGKYLKLLFKNLFSMWEKLL